MLVLCEEKTRVSLVEYKVKRDLPGCQIGLICHDLAFFSLSHFLNMGDRGLWMNSLLTNSQIQFENR